MESSCPLIKNILILDSEGKRIAVKYYGNDWCERHPPNHLSLRFPHALWYWGLGPRSFARPPHARGACRLTSTDDPRLGRVVFSNRPAAKGRARAMRSLSARWDAPVSILLTKRRDSLRGVACSRQAHALLADRLREVRLLQNAAHQCARRGCGCPPTPNLAPTRCLVRPQRPSIHGRLVHPSRSRQPCAVCPPCQPVAPTLAADPPYRTRADQRLQRSVRHTNPTGSGPPV